MLAAGRDFPYFLTAVSNVSIAIWVCAGNVAFGLISLPKTKSPVGGVKLAIMKGKKKEIYGFLIHPIFIQEKKRTFLVIHGWESFGKSNCILSFLQVFLIKE